MIFTISSSIKLSQDKISEVLQDEAVNLEEKDLTNLEQDNTIDLPKDNTIDLPQDSVIDLSQNNTNNVPQDNVIDLLQDSVIDLSENSEINLKQDKVNEVLQDNIVDLDKNNSNNLEEDNAIDSSKNNVNDSKIDDEIDSTKESDSTKDELTDSTRGNMTELTKDKLMSFIQKNVASSTQLNKSNNSSKSDIKQETFKSTLDIKRNEKNSNSIDTESKNVSYKNDKTEKEIINNEDRQSSTIEEVIGMLSAIVDLLQVPQLNENTVNIDDNTDVVEQTLETVSVNIGELFTNTEETFSDEIKEPQVTEANSQLVVEKGEIQSKNYKNALKEILNELVNKIETNEPVKESVLLEAKDILNKLNESISKNPEITVDTVMITKANNTVDEKLNNTINDKSIASNNKEEVLFPISNRTISNIKNDNIKNTDTKSSISNESQNQTKTVEKSILEKEDKFLKQVLGNDNEDDTTMNKFSLFTKSTVNESNDVSNINETNVVNKNSMAKDVVKNIKYMDVNGIKELVVKIKPKELGEMTIKLIQDDGVMKANIKASSKETYSLLSQNLNDIKKYLQDQNIKIQDVELGLYSDDTTFFKDGEFNNNSFNSNSFNGEHQSFRGNQQNTNSTDVTNENLEYEKDAIDISNINMLA